jgi:DNA gyrase subunit B
MDPEVFSEVIIPESFFIDVLTNFAMLSPGLTCTYINSAIGFKQILRFPSGASDYLNQIVNHSEIPLFKTKMHTFGQDRYNRPKYQAHLEVAIAFSMNGNSHKYIHNFKTIRYGGLHVRNIQERVCRVISDCFHEEIRTVSRHSYNAGITYGELQEHINIAVITFCPSQLSLWENGSQQAIINPMIADMAYDLVSGEFDTFVYNNRQALLPIIKKILEERNTTHN